MKVFYIDPQSYNNLSLYDYSLLSPMRDDQDVNLVYYHSNLYQQREKPVPDSRAVFCYNSKSNALLKSLSYIASMLKIACDLLSQRPKVVHVQWTRLWLVDCAFAVFARVCGCKMVHTAHNLLPHHPKHFDKVKCRTYYRLMSTIIVHTQRTANELITQFGIERQRVSVIHHGVLNNAVDEKVVAARMEVLRNRLGIKPDDMVFSCPGYQYRYKGVEMLADVWCGNACFHNNPNMHLLLVGKNRDVPYTVFERLGKMKNVFILDQQVDDLDFEAYLRMSSVVVLPYTTISQSGLLFTALCSGVPVAVSDVGGLTDPLRYAKVGWCMGEPTEGNLAAMLNYLMSHCDEIAKVRANKAAFNEILDKYSWQQISTDTRQLYMRLSGKNL